MSKVDIGSTPFTACTSVFCPHHCLLALSHSAARQARQSATAPTTFLESLPHLENQVCTWLFTPQVTDQFRCVTTRGRASRILKVVAARVGAPNVPKSVPVGGMPGPHRRPTMVSSEKAPSALRQCARTGPLQAPTARFLRVPDICRRANSPRMWRGVWWAGAKAHAERLIAQDPLCRADERCLRRVSTAAPVRWPGLQSCAYQLTAPSHFPHHRQACVRPHYLPPARDLQPREFG